MLLSSFRCDLLSESKHKGPAGAGHEESNCLRFLFLYCFVFSEGEVGALGKIGWRRLHPPPVRLQRLGLDQWRELAAGRNGKTLNIKDPVVPK